MLFTTSSHGAKCSWVSYYLNPDIWCPRHLTACAEEVVNTTSPIVLGLFPKHFGFDKYCFRPLQGRDVTSTLMSVSPIPVARVRRASTTWMVSAVYAPRGPITPAATRRWTSAWAVPASTGTVPEASAGRWLPCMNSSLLTCVKLVGFRNGPCPVEVCQGPELRLSRRFW